MRAALTLKGWPGRKAQAGGVGTGEPRSLALREGVPAKPRTGGHRTEIGFKCNVQDFLKVPRACGTGVPLSPENSQALVFVLEGMGFLNGVKGTERVASNRFYLSSLSFRISALQWAQRCSFNQKLVLHFLPVLVLTTMSTGHSPFFALQGKKAP